MALTVETGAIVSGADSYVSRSDFLDYAARLGTDVADTEDTDNLLRKAFNYINDLEPRLIGIKKTRDQAGAFPRVDCWIEGWHWNSSEIPQQVIALQHELALDLNAGIDIYNRTQSGSVAVRRERIEGVVEREYAVQLGAARLKVSRAVMLQAKIQRQSGIYAIPAVSA